jgi:general L-amino acid transport system permease protein
VDTGLGSHPSPSLAPEAGRSARVSVLARARVLVATPGNVLITLALVALAIILLPRLWAWAVTDATWSGTSRKDCGEAGACWIFIRARLHDLLYGSYPTASVWRVQFCAGALVLIGALAAWRGSPVRRGAALALLGFPLAASLLLHGGLLGLQPVDTRLWGGLLLNGVLTYVAVVVSIPLGLLLAEGRRSSLKEVAWTCTAFIEVWRAAPIVAILFFGVVILPLLLPRGIEFNKFACVAIALSLFSSAYMAEAIRGGLQALPRGQYEAALSLSLSPLRARLLVVWPQALRVSLPAIVNTGIDLLKDTSLVTIVGLFDILGALQQAIKDPQWLGLAAEGYAFIAALFLVLCSTLSVLSRRLERELTRDRR